MVHLAGNRHRGVGLLALAVLWGLFLSSRSLGKGAPPAWLLDLHRHLGGLAVVFVGVHLGALVADNFTHFGWSELFVPMASTWKTGPVAWGVAGFYLLIAIEVTSLLQRRMPRKWWRRVHFLSFPLYVIATVHLFTAGTDANNVLLVWAAVITSTLVVFLTIVRILGVRAANAHAALAVASSPAARPGAQTPTAATTDPAVRRQEMLARARAASREKTG